MSRKIKTKKHFISNKNKHDRENILVKYLSHLAVMCKGAGCENLFYLIPPDEMKYLYRCRLRQFKISAESEYEISNEIINNIRSFCIFFLNETKIDITGNNFKITLYEMLTFGMTFLYYLENLDENKYNNAKEVKTIKSRFLSFNELYSKSIAELRNIMFAACFEFSDLSSRIYWLKLDYKVHKKLLLNGIENNIKVMYEKPKKIHDDKDNYSRPAFRACWADAQTGVVDFYYSARQLGIPSLNGNNKIDIYIQNHALQRIKERLDCLQMSWLQLSLINSIMLAKIHLGKDNVYFIEFMLHEIKIGYLVADLKNNRLIIRTFLFITQNGTPEGNRLVDKFGLCRIDKSYLELDKLSTFIYNDMCSNQKLKEIFQIAGCQYLLDINSDERFRKMCNDHTKASSIEEIAKYLCLDVNESQTTKELVEI